MPCLWPLTLLECIFTAENTEFGVCLLSEIDFLILKWVSAMNTYCKFLYASCKGKELRFGKWEEAYFNERKSRKNLNFIRLDFRFRYCAIFPAVGINLIRILIQRNPRKKNHLPVFEISDNLEAMNSKEKEVEWQKPRDIASI